VFESTDIGGADPISSERRAYYGADDRLVATDIRSVGVRDPQGIVTSFQMNDRCAAGCGRYLGYIADAQSAWDRNRGKVAFPAWHGTLFESKRDGSGLEYARNRVYDPATGRFSQEGPIGLAGDLNAYGFTNGDPVNLSDPFGLKVCFSEWAADRAIELLGAELATNTRITLDENYCVSRYTPQGRPGFRGLQARFGSLISSENTYRVRLTIGGGSRFERREALIDQSQIGAGYPACPGRPGQLAPADVGALVAHELLGHGTGVCPEFS
jgi:RHS repeat-associated protein